MKGFLLGVILLLAGFTFSTTSHQPAHACMAHSGKMFKSHSKISWGLISKAHADEVKPSDAPKAQEMPQAPEGDPTVTLLTLLGSWKASSPIALGAMIILLLVQFLKSPLLGQYFKNIELKRTLITILGVVYGIVYMVSSGVSWANALVIGLLSSGGAVAIYQAIEPLLKKKTV